MTLENLHTLLVAHPVISTDSRKITPGCLFFALKGSTFNGNEYAAESLRKGAAYAVVDQKEYASGLQCILVPDALDCLQQLARYHRFHYQIPILGITGTNGKTTTKELVTAVLRQHFLHVVSTRGNLNNHIGVPLTLLEINDKTQFAVVEMGANHPGEISDLCRIAAPTSGLITNIGRAHLEGFGQQETIIDTKKALFDSVAQQDGMLFVNAEQPILVNLSEGKKRLLFGKGAGAAIRGIRLDSGPYLHIGVETGGVSFTIKSKLVGSYNFDNILAAVAVGIHFEIPPDRIVAGIESYEPANNRSQILQTTRNLLILDAYNANPTSMKAALESFLEFPGQPKALILGDMLELGGKEEEEHRQILSLLPHTAAIKVFLVGPVFQKLNQTDTFTAFPDTASLSEYLFQHPLHSYTILIKGSRGIALEKVIDSL